MTSTLQVDHENAIIRGVSIITSGIVARGHDLAVDATTVTQLLAAATAKGQVPVKVDHKSGAGAVCGFLTNFHVEGNKLKADWHLLQSHPQRDQILETCERMPSCVGMSAAFLPPERSEPGKARVAELVGVDYVTLPAANPEGMFSARVDPVEFSLARRAARITGAALAGGALGGVGGLLSARGRRVGAAESIAGRIVLAKKLRMPLSASHVGVGSADGQHVVHVTRPKGEGLIKGTFTVRKEPVGDFTGGGTLRVRPEKLSPEQLRDSAKSAESFVGASGNYHCVSNNCERVAAAIAGRPSWASPQVKRAVGGAAVGAVVAGGAAAVIQRRQEEEVREREARAKRFSSAIGQAFLNANFTPKAVEFGRQHLNPVFP